MTPIYPYQTREVRDLAWACFSPPLLHAEQLANDGQNVADCAVELTPLRRRWLQQLDRDASALLAHLARQRSHRLGVYFEHLWHFFLEQDPAIDLVAHNLPIHHDGRTLGEFDCLYYCRERQRHYHLELAVKFFLSNRSDTADEPVSHWHEWLGPNTRDRLDLKIRHLLDRQIELAEHPVARAQLGNLGIRDLAKEVVIKGYLFQSVADPLPPPYAFNAIGSLQQWLPINRLESYTAGLETNTFLVLPRARWLAAARVVEWADQGLDSAALENRLSAHFSGDIRPQLVAALDASGCESRRFFVTATNWPQH